MRSRGVPMSRAPALFAGWRLRRYLSFRCRHGGKAVIELSADDGYRYVFATGTAKSRR